ncbi:MAG: hypothetical protein VX026_06810 [Myxococcota bacterium]|nr:hypothetical protein [Myxococcota bacterium]
MVLNALLWILACQPQVPPKRATSPIQIQVLAVQDNLLDRNSTTVPADLRNTLKAELSNANIQPTIIEVPNSFQSIRQTEQRLDALGTPVLLIETKAEFFSQLEGRFRWSVNCKLTLNTGEQSALVREFDTPVFHQFHHQREAEAILAAEEVIRQQLRGLIEDYLRSQTP